MDINKQAQHYNRGQDIKGTKYQKRRYIFNLI